jgi:hypothetical protein
MVGKQVTQAVLGLRQPPDDIGGEDHGREDE